MSTPVRDEQPSPLPEQLVLGPRPDRRLSRWLPVAALAIGLLIVAGAAVWRFWPRPIEPLSLLELQGTYEGMVRSDGTNDASVLTRRSVAETPVTVTPAECSPLLEATMANRIPAAALDGVGTYWIGQGSTTSLFTMRFTDADQAETERTRIADALDACADRQITVRTQESAAPWQPTVVRTSTGSDDQPGYTLDGPNGLTAIQLMPYLNTVTWQYRYETGSATYTPLAANQLMQSLHAQLDAVVAGRPR
jgi:hypothetical protein